MAGDDQIYHPQDAVKAAFQAAGIVGTSGFFVAAVHNALQRENVGALSVFTRSGGIIAVFGTPKAFYTASSGFHNSIASLLESPVRLC